MSSARDVLATWEEAADAWDQFVETGLDFYRTELHGPALLDACGLVRGRSVLDLGCGQGWFTRRLARAGASVVGVDWSTRLIAHALRHEAAAPLGAVYEVLDAVQVGARFAGRSFDLITGCMSVMDMPRPGAVLAAARTLLGPGGRLVMSVPNPVTDSSYREWERDPYGRKTSLKIDRYFEARTNWMDWNLRRLPVRFRTVQFRFTLEQWSAMFAAAGLVIARMWEPRPSEEAVALRPELADARRVPFFLLFDLRATGLAP